MCVTMIGQDGSRSFDPTRCPLLQGLTSEEADRMMANDPRIRACIAAMECGTPSVGSCSEKMLRAYDRQKPKKAKVA